MAARIVLVPADSAVLADPGTTRLAEYGSGEVLVSTDAAPDDRERAPERGLALPGAAAESAPRLPQDGNTVMLGFVELAGPVHRDWLEALTEAGLELLAFQPVSSYRCRGPVRAFRAAAKLPFVVSVRRSDGSEKPATRVTETGEEPVWIVADANVADADALLAALRGLAGVTVDGRVDLAGAQLRVPAEVTSAGAAAALALPAVLAVDARIAPAPEDEVAGLVLAGQYDASGHPAGSYLQWLEDRGVNGAGVTIGIVDNGVDEDHVAFSGRITAKDPGRAWHGTFVAGHAAGDYRDETDPDGFIYGVGMAPAAELISQDNQALAGTVCKQTVTETGPGGVAGTVQNNSWGAGTQDPMDYRSQEATYDALVRDADGSGTPLTICFSAGNSGSAGLTRPKAAKNIIVTGNSENYRPTVGGSDSDDIDEVYTGDSASSYGNCGDGRIRPHVIAPGEWTSSANYDSHPGDAEYISDLLTWGGGTSGASPKTAGACALITEWWRSVGAGRDPSPALLRALVVNGAVDTGFGGSIPNHRQGWGRLNLDAVLNPGVHRVYLDQTVLLTTRGDGREWRLRVSDPSLPVRATLAWTDPPGAVGSGTATSPAIVNSLELRATAGGVTYYGNVFDNGWSAEGEPTGSDNVQNVYLRDGGDGELTVVVEALNITTNCLTGGVADPQQDFALVVTNAHLDDGSTPVDLVVVVDDGAVSGGDPGGGDHWEPGSSDDDDTSWWEEHDRPVVKRGSRGEAVTQLQTWLNELGYDAGVADGIFGSGTDAAVRAFQRDQGLTADGIAGEATWTALEAAIESGGTSGNEDPTSGDDTSSGGDDTSSSDDDWWDAGGDDDWDESGDDAPEDDTPPEETRRRKAALAEAGRRGAAVGGGATRLAPAAEADRGLSATLAALMREWDGPPPADGRAIRRRAAVVVVGPATRVSRDDLAALRRLATLGSLTLVSADRATLAWFAQRLHLVHGIAFRLGGEEAVREAAAEAGGGQRLLLDVDTRERNGKRETRVRFRVTGDDERLVLTLRGAALDAISVPGGRKPTVTDSADGVRIEAERAAGGAWTGVWEVRIAGEATAEGWIWSHVRLRPEIAGAEAERRLCVRGTGGARYSRLRVERASTGPAAEADRPLDATVQPRRRGAPTTAAGAAPTTEAGGGAAPTAATLSVPLPTEESARGGAGIEDLLVTATGVTAAGEPFDRCARANAVTLQSRRAFRRGHRRTGRRLVTATVAEVRYGDDGTVTGLGLEAGGKRRTVRVADPKLGRLLAPLELLGEELVFGVEGARVCAVVRLLPEVTR